LPESNKSPMAPPESGRLAGRRIVLTRAADACKEWTEALVAEGAEVIAISPIAFEEPRDVSAAERVLERLEAYDWLAFTSGQGVEFFLQRLRRKVIDWPDASPRIACVGPATASALRAAGLPVQLVATRHDATGLADALAAHAPEGSSLLWVRPEVSHTGLAEKMRRHGWRVDSASFYRNVMAPQASELVALLLSGSCHVLVVTAPSALARLFEAAGSRADALREELRRKALVTLGVSTDRAVDDAGLKVAARCAEATPSALLAAVLGL